MFFLLFFFCFVFSLYHAACSRYLALTLPYLTFTICLPGEGNQVSATWTDPCALTSACQVPSTVHCTCTTRLDKLYQPPEREMALYLSRAQDCTLNGLQRFDRQRDHGYALPSHFHLPLLACFALCDFPGRSFGQVNEIHCSSVPK